MPERQQPTAVGTKRRACVNCTAGKAKCSPLSDNVCERCHRLGKDCIYLNVVSKRRSPKSNSRVQLLEKKVEGLATLLASQSKASQAQGPAEHSQDAFSSRDSAILQSFRSPGSSEATSNPTPLTSLPESNTDDFGALDIIDRGLVSVETAQILLDLFRCKAAWNFPFVIVPLHTTLNSIRRDSPFLFLSIIASMSFDNSPLQRKLGEEIRTQIHRRMLLGFESSLELLQGLLVHLAWHYYFILPHKHQMLLLSQMCVTLVHQLEIDKNPKNKKRRLALELGDHEQEDTATKSPAEIRAMLGTYYLSSSFATSFRRRSFMPYTKYINQCCVYLAQKKELPTDELVMHFVRNQELSRRVQDTFSYDDLDNTEIRGEQITDITSRSLLRELDNLQSTVPDALQHNTILTLEFLLLRSWIYEVAFHGEFWVTPGRDTSSALQAFSVTTARIKLLLISLQSWKAFLEAFVSIPNSEMLYLTYPIHSKLCYTLVSLANLVHLNLCGGLENELSEGCLWKLGVAAREAELPFLARQVQEKFKANARSEVGAEEDPNAMTIFSVLIGSLISSYEKRMRELQTAMSSEKAASSMSEPTVAQDQMITDMDSTFFLGADAISTDFYGDAGPFYLGQDSNIELDLFEDTVWERLLDDFTMVPFSC